MESSQRISFESRIALCIAGNDGARFSILGTVASKGPGRSTKNLLLKQLAIIFKKTLHFFASHVANCKTRSHFFFGFFLVFHLIIFPPLRVSDDVYSGHPFNAPHTCLFKRRVLNENETHDPLIMMALLSCNEQHWMHFY